MSKWIDCKFKNGKFTKIIPQIVKNYGDILFRFNNKNSLNVNVSDLSGVLNLNRESELYLICLGKAKNNQHRFYVIIRVKNAFKVKFISSKQFEEIVSLYLEEKFEYISKGTFTR